MIGEIKLFAGRYIPDGWLECNGQRVSGTQYNALVQVLGSSRLPKTGEITVTAHLEPEDDGTHEKVIAQAKSEGLPGVSGIKYIIRYKEDPQISEADVRRIVESYLAGQG